METPVFKLPGIVKDKDDASDFEGPLALILELLRKNKVEIRDISISLILEQYIAYLDKMAELNLDIASEFIVMASHLMDIKTKVMLNEGEEVSELEELMTSLERLQRGDMYLKIKEAAETLSGMYTRDGMMLAGPPEYYLPDTEYKYVHISNELLDAIYRLVGKENLKLSSINPNEPFVSQRVKYPIKNKIAEIVSKLKCNGDMAITSLFQDCESRTELIAVLIAVLELCRVGSACVTGNPENIKIMYTGSGREDEITDFTLDDTDGDAIDGET